MSIPPNLLVNADDLGLTLSINKAISFCYEREYINSSSLLTNTIYWNETIQLIRENPSMINLGVHINFADGRPLTNSIPIKYLDGAGNWNLIETGRLLNFFNKKTQWAFLQEINAQIDKALDANINITHIDSHYHLHTLPCFNKLFLLTAKRYKLKVRIAQTFNGGSYLKYAYREHINNRFKKANVHYTNFFETVSYFLDNKSISAEKQSKIELMLHPDYDALGQLTDHFDALTMSRWIHFLKNR